MWREDAGKQQSKSHTGMRRWYHRAAELGREYEGGRGREGSGEFRKGKVMREKSMLLHERANASCV